MQPFKWLPNFNENVGTQSSRGKVLVINAQKQDEPVTILRQQDRHSNQNNLIYIELWQWVIDHEFPRTEIEGHSATNNLI